MARVEVAPGARVRVAHNVPGRASGEGHRLPRVILVCNRHPGGFTNGRPLAVPRRTLAPRTTTAEPQRERLFDVGPYKRAGVAADMAVMVMSDRIRRRRREVAEGWATGRHAELDAELTLRLPDDALDALADAVADRLAERQAPAADGWLDTRTAARYLGLSVHAVHRLVARREIPYSQEGPGAECYFKRSALDGWRGG